MEDMRAYLLSVSGAALISSIAKRFLEKNGSTGEIGKMIIGIFLVLVILQPISTLDLSEWKYWDLQLDPDAVSAVHQGEEITHQAISQNIKHQTAAYIVQKAERMGVTLAVDVCVSHDTVPRPEKVYLTGAVSPYAKQQLTRLIEQDLGIPKENQIWT